MSYSRRQLEAFGEPLGDSVTRKEGGRIIYGGGGGGGGTQTHVVDVPGWARDTAERTLKKTEALTTDRPFQTYSQFARQQGMDPTQVAGFQNLQNRAFAGAENLQPSAALGAGMGLAGTAAARALNMGYAPYQAQNQYEAPDAYAPTQFQNRFAAPGAYQAGQFGVERVSAPQLEQFQMGPAERVRADTFGGRQAAQYMSPYIEQALAPQLREAQRASEIQRNANQAQAVQQGAFGGSRQAIVEAERQRNLGTQMGDIRARGLQSAYEQAQQQFNQDAARRLQAQQLNQQAGLTTGQQNLAALLGVQQLGAQTGMQAQLANQQQVMEAQRLAEQSRQFGAGQGLSAAQLQAQYGLSADQATEASRQFAANQAAQQAQQRAQFGQAAQQLAEQSRQYGAGLGLQGLQTALTGAGQLGQLGAQQFGQQKDILGLQNQLGTQQQQYEQALINARMQDYQAQQKYPYQQLEFMSNILRGTPMGTVQTMYAPQPSLANQVMGAGTSLAGAYMMGGGRFAEGGSVDAPAGLADLALSKM
jgi:bisphosphoglycerate-dependent phosphoglycerate mutase